DDLASNPAYKKLVTETLPLLAEKGISGAVSGDETRKQMDREITAVLAQMLDQQSDVFSLGAVFYVMLTGSTIGKTDADFLIIDPFSPDGRQFSRWARFDPPLEKLDTIQYPAVAEVISTMLRHKRSERYRSMREVKAALQTTGFSELPPLQARLSRSERLSLRLQATLQSDLPTLLREAGVLQDDVDSLMELTDDQRIRGDFQLLGVVARLKHQQLHSVVLRAYARELVHLLITNAGIEEVTQRFIRQVTRSRFEQMRSVIEDNWDMRFSNDAHFMQELIDFYADSQFSGANRDVFSSPEFDNLASALKYAVGTRLYITLIFSPGEVYDAESFLDRQVLFVRILADTARQAGLNIAVFDRKTGEKIDSELISVIERTIFHSRAVESSL
ncbi:hypothetical protein KDK77_10385, partial [bacterium]|nr:hypothetical protein [bacterium]